MVICSILSHVSLAEKVKTYIITLCPSLLRRDKYEKAKEKAV